MAGTRVVLTVEEYLDEVLALVSPLAAQPGAVEEVPLHEALGRTLAAPLSARGDVPAFANSAMDGFAVRAGSLTAGDDLEVAAEVLAGSGEDPRFGDGQCIRIMTGAPVPTDADAVVPVELTTALGEGRVRIDETVPRGRHVRGAGEDVHAGDEVLPQGSTLGPSEVAAAAAAGVSAVACVRRPWVGVLATGDELVPPGQPLGRGQIHESNGTYLGAALARQGARPVVAGIVRDDPAVFAQTLDAVAARCDLIVVSGGVSVGDADVTRIVLEGAGATFRHVRMQPGKPQGWARWGERGVPVIALPGNPLSVAVSHDLFVRAALDRLLGRPHPVWTPALAGATWTSPPGRRQFVPVTVVIDPDGRQVAHPAHRRGSASHMVTALAGADALVSVPEDVSTVRAGDRLTLRRLP